MCYWLVYTVHMSFLQLTVFTVPAITVLVVPAVGHIYTFVTDCISSARFDFIQRVCCRLFTVTVCDLLLVPPGLLFIAYGIHCLWWLFADHVFIVLFYDYFYSLWCWLCIVTVGGCGLVCLMLVMVAALAAHSLYCVCLVFAVFTWTVTCFFIDYEIRLSKSCTYRLVFL